MLNKKWTLAYLENTLNALKNIEHLLADDLDLLYERKINIETHLLNCCKYVDLARNFVPSKLQNRLDKLKYSLVDYLLFILQSNYGWYLYLNEEISAFIHWVELEITVFKSKI